MSISNASETDKYVEAKILYPLANPYLWKSSIGSVGCEVKFETPYGIMKMPCADYKLNLIKAAKQINPTSFYKNRSVSGLLRLMLTGEAHDQRWDL